VAENASDTGEKLLLKTQIRDMAGEVWIPEAGFDCASLFRPDAAAVPGVLEGAPGAQAVKVSSVAAARASKAVRCLAVFKFTGVLLLH
jgi:hypothetical protein